MTETNYVEVSNDYSPGYYVDGYDDDPWSSGTIAGYGDIKTEVIGDLADRVRARAHVDGGKVYIIEAHWDDGYCVTCSYERVAFDVLVDDQVVYTTRDNWVDPEPESAREVSTLSEFNAWLNGGEQND